MTALRGFRIIELAERVSGEYCGKLLSDFGAEVVKVERVGIGSPTRSLAPLAGEGDDRERSGLFAYLNTNKRSVTLDLTSSAGRAALQKLIASADAVIDDHDESWLKAIGLGPGEAARDYPSVVFCAVTPFGYGAPSDWKHAQSLNVFHVSGWGFHTPTHPDPRKPPLKGPGRFVVDYEGALDAALCIVSALVARNRGGSGEFIDVAQLATLVSRCDCVVGRFLAGDIEPGHERTHYDQGGPHTFFPCKDGSVYLYMTSKKHWAGFRTLLGDPEWAKKFDDNWLEFAATTEAVAECRSNFAVWVKDQTKDDVAASAQKLGVPIVAVNSAPDLHRSPQYQFRAFFQRLAHPVLGEALYPTVPYKLSASPAHLATSAPRLGQDDNLISALTAKRLPQDGARDARHARTAKTARGGPLEGVRVLEMTKVWAGPYAGKLLALLGAEVIKVESKHNLDEMRAYGGVDINHAPYFLSVNPQVMSMELNTKSEEGLALLRDMVAKSDIVLNNLRPGAMERSGLGYADLRKIKPDIISVSVKMFGNDGPLGYQTGYAPCFAALGGLNYMVGYEGEAPAGINMRYGDATVGANAALAAVIALLHRDRTGEGQFVDVSAVECMSSLVGDSLLEFSLTGKSQGPDGNRHADMAPHGCYPCLGGDWLSLAVASDAEWQVLAGALDRPDLAADPQLATLSGRQANLHRLDALLADATRGHDAHALASRLRALGVAAFKSATSIELIQNEHLWQRDFYRFVSDSKEGQRPILGTSWHLSRNPASNNHGAPALGEHNQCVYCDILGLSPERLQELIRAAVVE